MSAQDDEALVETIADALHRTDHLVRTPTWHRRLASISGVDLGRSGYSILTSLETDGAQRPTDLAEQFGLDQSTVSRRIAALERLGFVERHSDVTDGRVSRVSLSSGGRKALRRHRRAVITTLGMLVEDWSDEQREALAESMSRFADALGAAVRSAREAPTPTEERERRPRSRQVAAARVTQRA